MTGHRVIILDEKPRIIEFVQDNYPGVAYINRSLKDFEPKVVFAWHLSIMINIQDAEENALPSKKEQKILDELGKTLDINIKGSDKGKPNALFLARITWNMTREMIWRVYNAELADRYLKTIVSDKSFLRSFDYRINPDKDWKLAEWHLTI